MFNRPSMTWAEHHAKRWRKVNPFDQFLAGIPHALFLIAATLAVLVL